MNRDGRDDEDMVPQWSRVPRPSEPTRVGLGVVEGSRARNGDTPPSGVDLGDLTRGNGNGPPTPRNPLSETLAKGDVSVILEQINRAVDARKEETAALRIDLNGKVDACIDEVRAVAKTMHDFVTSQAKRDEAIFALLPIPARVDAVETLAKDLDERVGQAPNKLAERASLTRELTSTEYVELERGTGLAGVTGRLVAADRRLAARIGLVAVVASTVPQLALVLLAEGHVLWILYSVAALVLAALSVFAFRRVRRAWRSRS